MRLDLRVKEEVLSWLPERLIRKLTGPEGGVFFAGQEGDRTCVVYENDWDEIRVCGISVRQGTDEFDERVGYTVAAVSCLRAANLLPKSKRNKRQASEQFYGPSALIVQLMESIIKCLRIEKEGAVKRGLMALESKNYWADRARMAEEKLSRNDGNINTPDFSCPRCNAPGIQVNEYDFRCIACGGRWT